MEQGSFQSGYYDQTVLNPLGLIAILVLGGALLVVRRRYAVWPMIIMGCFIAPAQRIAILTLNFDLLRIMVLFGTIRIFARGEAKRFEWRPMDSVLVAFAMVGTIIYILQDGTMEAVKTKSGTMYDILGMYFLFRCLVRNFDDIARIAMGFSLVSVPVAMAFINERVTGRNMFAVFGGVHEITVVREGRLRCQGAYSHPILAGCYWASVLPLMAALWWQRGVQRGLGMVGVACGMTIIILCSSSTPVSAVGFGLLGAGLFPLRRRLRLIRWAVLGILLALHLGMQAPVWNLLARIDFAGGSTGWHRANLISQFMSHVNDWWLLGIKSVESWGIWSGDITNQYFLEAARGGIWALSLLITLIVMAFSNLGRLWRKEESNRLNLIQTWAIGVSLFVHCVIFIGVSYFGQITMLWYLALAMIVSLSPQSCHTSTAVRNAATRTARINVSRRLRI